MPFGGDAPEGASQRSSLTPKERMNVDTRQIGFEHGYNERTAQRPFARLGKAGFSGAPIGLGASGALIDVLKAHGYGRESLAVASRFADYGRRYADGYSIPEGVVPANW